MDSRGEVVIQRESLGETMKCDAGSQWTYCTMKRLKFKIPILKRCSNLARSQNFCERVLHRYKPILNQMTIRVLIMRRRNTISSFGNTVFEGVDVSEGRLNLNSKHGDGKSDSREKGTGKMRR